MGFVGFKFSALCVVWSASVKRARQCKLNVTSNRKREVVCYLNLCFVVCVGGRSRRVKIILSCPSVIMICCSLPFLCSCSTWLISSSMLAP